MRTPDCGNLVMQRQGRIGIVGHIQHGEIIADEAVGQAGIGHGDEQQLSACRGLCHGHPLDRVGLGTKDGNQRLHECQTQGQDQREMTDFRNHGALRPYSAMLLGSESRYSSRLAATSGGM